LSYQVPGGASSIAGCQTACQSKGYIFAAPSYGTECWWHCVSASFFEAGATVLSHQHSVPYDGAAKKLGRCLCTSRSPSQTPPGPTKDVTRTLPRAPCHIKCQGEQVPLRDVRLRVSLWCVLKKPTRSLSLLSDRLNCIASRPAFSKPALRCYRSYQGCYSDSSSRTLSYQVPGGASSIAGCQTACQSKGYI
jgi:hypothetical protein